MSKRRKFVEPGQEVPPIEPVVISGQVEKTYIPFSNPETAAQYESLIGIDQWVHVPAIFGEDKCFKGMISTIWPQAARRYVLSGGNLIRKKEASPETETV